MWTCAAHVGLGPATLVLYDVTTLYFETDEGVEEGPVRQDHRRRQGRGLEPGRTGPLPGRVEGLRHRHDVYIMDGLHVVTAYHELCQVERSFRMAKSDLAARPMFHRICDSIEAT